MGKIKQCNGVKFTQTEIGEIRMSQKNCSLKLLERFGMENLKPL